MQFGHVTTPVGRRPMTLALVKRQLDTADISSGKSVEKWKVFRDVCEARVLLGVQDRALTVLDALLTFHPQNELVEGQGLVVFPSNMQLSVRAHGMTGTTLRRHLAALVEAGLIVRRDSPNGKRYAHKDQSGTVEQAFGFSLAPLLVRAEELAALAQQVAADRRQFLRTKEALSICRRDVRKLISAAMEEGAQGNWEKIEDHYVALIARIGRSPSQKHIAAVLDEMQLLRDEIVMILEIQVKTEKIDVNDDHFGRHIQNSNTESIHELEPSSGNEQGERPAPEQKRLPEPLKPFPLGMVLRACPEIAMYGPGGAISSWRDMMAAAVVVRSMLGVSPSAYQDACDVMGPENAATAVACILERAGHINSAGGYLRDLTRRSERGEFGLGPMLMALLRNQAGGERQTG